jgi:hypothetical protein
MIRYDVAAFCEGFTADPAFHALLDNLAGQQFPHFGS